jgi:predicted transcriptional regulator
MNSLVPSIADVRYRLSSLKDGELDRIAKASGVPASTLWKIRIGDTSNPGLETVRKFFHLLPTTPAANDTNAAQAAEQGAG